MRLRTGGTGDLNLTPARTIVGLEHGFSLPVELVVSTDGTLYVSNNGSQSVAVFDRLAVETFSAWCPDSSRSPTIGEHDLRDGSTVTVKQWPSRLWPLVRAH